MLQEHPAWLTEVEEDSGFLVPRAESGIARGGSSVPDAKCNVSVRGEKALGMLKVDATPPRNWQPRAIFIA